jgi:hypothetical protein
MSDTQIIAATVKVDTGTSNANVKELNKSVVDLKGNLKDTGANVKEASKALTETGGSFSKLKESIASVPGPMASATAGVGKLNLAFKALLANPVVLVITAIIGVLALLYKAFTNTFEGGEKMEQIFAGIKAAGQALIDNIIKIAGAIVKLFKFDFSGAINDIKGVVKAVGDAYVAMAKLTEEAQKLHREQLVNDLEQAERQKQLAILREQATDETIPVAKRKAALLELKDAAEENAKNDIALARKVAENKIAQLTLEKDGARKNQDEINKIKIEQINVETENANELRRIGKQITNADRQELADRKQAADEARAREKEERQKFTEFATKLRKLEQENALAEIKDGYAKEKQALENKVADDILANDRAFQERRLNRAQHQKIAEALDIQANLQRQALTDKHNKETADKEEKFQIELSKITQATVLDGIRDSRELEKMQLEITHQEKLAQAIKDYKDDAVKLQAIKNALNAQLKAEQDKLEAKIKKEDEKKKFEEEEKRLKIISGGKSPLEQKKAALDAEQKLIDQAFQNKILSEEEYNTKVQSLSEARREIDQLEFQHKMDLYSAISSALNTVSDILGKNTVAGKALAASASLINTYAAIAGQLKAFAGVPIPGYAIAQAIATGLVGFKAVRDIIAVKVPAASGSGPSVSAPSTSTPSAPLAPIGQSTSLNQDSINKIGNAATPTRAYVLDADSTNRRERNERLNRAARLGG